MKVNNQDGFEMVQFLGLIFIVGIICATSWYVYRSQRATRTTLDNASQVLSEPQKATNKESAIASLAPDPNKTSSSGKLEIKEWNVSIELSSIVGTVYYKVDQYNGKDANITVYSKSADAIMGPSGVSCKGEYIAYLLRMPINDPQWNDQLLAGYYSTHKEIGEYTYAISTKKQYGPQCFDTGSGPGDYKADTTTMSKFQSIADSFAADFNSIK